MILAVLVMLAAAAPAISKAAPSADERPPPLARASEIRRLSREQTAAGRAVQLHGVILAVDAARRAVFLHDGGAGIMVIVTDPGAVRSGDIADVAGVTWSGGLAPAVTARSITVTGHGALPPPERATMMNLTSGVLDGQWLDLDGIVRSLAFDGDDVVAQIVIDGWEFALRVLGPVSALQDVRVNSSLRVRAVCEVDVDNGHRPVGVRLLSPGRGALQILEAGTVDTFALPIRAIQSLSEFNTQRAFGRLVHVRGTVELQRPGTSLFIRDASASVYVGTHETTPVTIGDVVDAVGFLANDDGPTLERASYRLVGHGTPLSPRDVAVSHIREGQVVDDLVRLTARLTNFSTDSLFLQAAGLNFVATLDGGGFEKLGLVPESDLRLTGIGIVVRADGKFKAFKMRLRNVSDVQIVRRPWWGSLARILWLLAGAMVLVVLLGGSNLALGRRLRRQTAIIRERMEREAALEARLHHSEKMEAIGQLAGGIAHDFNNLLTAVQGNAQFLLDDLPAGASSRNEAESIMQASRRAAELTQQLLAFSRKQVLTPTVLRIGSVISDVAPMLRHLLGKNVELRMIISDMCAVKADAGQLERVVVNLVINARDAMSGAGVLTIATSDESASPSGPQVLLAVTDTGCGMDAPTRARVFEPFFTTKSSGQGSGLGLATVYGIVKQSGGSIEVDSGVGVGSTFKIHLPCTDEPISTPPDVVVPRSATGTETILVVEDEDSVRRLIEKSLSRLGYRVHAVSSPSAALDFGRGHRQTIHLLLSDVMLPEMNGRVFAKAFCEQHPESRCLFMSGYADDVFGANGVLKPGTPFIGKPFTADGLATKIRQTLESAVTGLRAEQ